VFQGAHPQAAALCKLVSGNFGCVATVTCMCMEFVCMCVLLCMLAQGVRGSDSKAMTDTNGCGTSPSPRASFLLCLHAWQQRMRAALTHTAAACNK
jgi:hypothetical protein